MKLLQFVCGLFGHKWVTYTKGQMCKRCGKKKNMDKWYCEIQNKATEIIGITHWMPLPQPPKSGSSEFPNNCEKGGEE